jgi:hypothetical protein
VVQPGVVVNADKDDDGCPEGGRHYLTNDNTATVYCTKCGATF